MKDPETMTVEELYAELGPLTMSAEEAEYRYSASVGNRIADALCRIPAAKRNAKACAEAAYAVVREMSAEIGQNPDIETMFKTPAESHNYMGGTPGIYIVAWESGPYQWAIGASMEIGHRAGKLVEPYWSFDLCFYPAED